MADLAVIEQVILQRFIELGIAATDPFQGHGRMLLFLVAVVREDFLQLGICEASQRWLDQSTAASSFIRLTMARCISLVSSDRYFGS